MIQWCSTFLEISHVLPQNTCKWKALCVHVAPPTHTAHLGKAVVKITDFVPVTTHFECETIG
jgi:hypothetical protein